MTSQNPYAPPVETSDIPPTMVPDTGGLTLSERGWSTVTSLAKWMRIVSTFFYVFGGLMIPFALLMLVNFNRAQTGAGAGVVIGTMVFMVFVTVMLFIGATWLRGAAFHFYDGVLSNTEHALAQGFRKLRLYLILYGVYGILGLLLTIVKLVVAS